MDTAIPAGLAAATTSTTLQSTNKADQQKSQFLKLLVAQLKGQNPLDPKDGTEFISQLAQFSSLEELINIRTALENFKNVTSATPGTPGNPFQPGV
jgi:flagellar basal-body rod modification protein FlgD